jgi:hypothetical protein
MRKQEKQAGKQEKQAGKHEKTGSPGPSDPAGSLSMFS